ncbi:MAG: hypothetical protein Q8O55_10760 [Dehalococcoidales bacterium]|nr:hypothetical protein [Dehalococcoidales bacterium]
MTEQKGQEMRCFCPYCDEELMSANLPFCQMCKVTIIYCSECEKPLPRDKKVCIYCGTEIKD